MFEPRFIATRCGWSPVLVLCTAVAVCAAATLAGCGQRGPLYMPDRNARVVTHAANADSSAPSSAPAESPAAASAPSSAPR